MPKPFLSLFFIMILTPIFGGQLFSQRVVASVDSMERLDQDLGLLLTSYLTSVDTSRLRASCRANELLFQRNVPSNTEAMLFFEVPWDLSRHNDPFFMVCATKNPQASFECWRLELIHADKLFRRRWRRFHKHARVLFDTHDFVLALIHAGGRLDCCSSRLCQDPSIIAAASAGATPLPMHMSSLCLQVIKCLTWSALWGGVLSSFVLREDDSISRQSIKAAVVFCFVVFPYIRLPFVSEQNIINAGDILFFLVVIPVMDVVLDPPGNMHVDEAVDALL